MEQPDPTDVAFFESVRSCVLPLDAWDHCAHLRTAYTCLRLHGMTEAIEEMRAIIQRYNRHHDVPEGPESGYHETVTQGWLRLLDQLMRAHGSEATFDAFVERHPYVREKFLLRMLYRRRTIMSSDAKRSYVPPDLLRFPRGDEQ